MSVKRLSIIYFYIVQIYVFSVVFLSWKRFSTITANGLRIGDGGVFEKRLAGQVKLIEKLKLKLRTKAQSCLSSPNHSLDLQLADVCLSSHTWTKPTVVRRFGKAIEKKISN